MVNKISQSYDKCNSVSEELIFILEDRECTNGECACVMLALASSFFMTNDRPDLADRLHEIYKDYFSAAEKIDEIQTT